MRRALMLVPMHSSPKSVFAFSSERAAHNQAEVQHAPRIADMPSVCAVLGEEELVPKEFLLHMPKLLWVETLYPW